MLFQERGRYCFMICKNGKALFLIVFFFIAACRPNDKLQQLKAEVVAFERQQIVIPSGLVCVKSGQVLSEWGLEDIPHFVYYFDSTECVGCRLQHVINLSPLFQEDSYGEKYDVIPIFAPKVEDRDKILQEAKYALHDYSLYLDLDGRFLKENPRMPSDSRFHCFLLNREGNPIFVGDPAANPKMRRLFSKIEKRLPKRNK